MIDVKAVFGLISEAEYAEIRHCEIATLTNERSRGKGPPWTKIGNKTYYPVKGLRKEIAAKTVTPKPKPPTLIDGVKPKKSPPKKSAKAADASDSASP
jgi:hypothetical protein